MQIHNFWGIVGRRAVSYSKSSRPWDPTSEFSQMARRLAEWEQGLPHEHMWSNFLLKGYKAEGQYLVCRRPGLHPRARAGSPWGPRYGLTPSQPYLCVTMMTRLCNIVLRRPYLIE